MRRPWGRYGRSDTRIRGLVAAVLCLTLLAVLTIGAPPALAETIVVGSTVEVTGTGGDGLNIRSASATSGIVVGVEKDAVKGTALEGPVAGEGFTWWRVQWTDGLTGWSVAQYLKVSVPSPVPSSPTAVQAVAGTESVILSWGIPEWSGTSPISAWHIYRDRHAGPTTLVATLAVGSPGFDTRTWADGPMLVGGRQYWYAVSAVNANGEGGHSKDALVTPQVARMPDGVFFLPPQLDFGGELQSLVLTLQNTGTLPVSFDIVAGASWLVGVSPVKGTIPVSGSQTISVGVQRTGMPAGTYESLVRVTCSNGSINIPVEMRVGMIQGIDVSRWQCGADHAGDPINWAAVRSEGYQFVFVKATEGVSITDAFLNVLAPRARSAGLLTGVYHIGWPADNTAAAEAAAFLQAAGQYIAPGFLVPVLDIEPRYNIGGAAMVRWIDEWSGVVRAAKGVSPIIYCSASVAANLHKADPTIDGRYHLWVAGYAPAAQPNTGGWGSWSFWQHADNGTVPGIEGHSVDLDWFNGNEQTLSQYVISGVSNTTYNLLSAVVGNGLLGVEPQKASFASGSTVTLTARPAAGWAFTGWGGSVSGRTNPLALTMDGDKSVLATFERVVAPKQHVVTLTVGSTVASVDGQKIMLDTPPVIVSGRTVVPLRAIIEGLGGTVTWIPETRSVHVVLSGKTLQLQIGNRTAIVEGESVTMDVSAAIMKGRTILPVRFVAEHLGAQVDWEQLTRKITITLSSATTSSGTSIAQ
jgi:GH25 family lysozyme M1 (1,4-beta-N-acetylmuramidase)